MLQVLTPEVERADRLADHNALLNTQIDGIPVVNTAIQPGNRRFICHIEKGRVRTRRTVDVRTIGMGVVRKSIIIPEQIAEYLRRSAALYRVAGGVFRKWRRGQQGGPAQVDVLLDIGDRA